MKLSSFSVILTFVILMIIGVALAPLIDVGTEPTPRQGKRMTIKYEWPHVSAKVVEQNLTSPIEGMVSALKGVESVSSKSYFGKSEIVVNLKENVDVSSVRFEISSLLGQSHERLPKGVSYPTLMGGEVVSGMASHNAQKLLLTYLVNADIQPELIKNFVKENVVRQLEAVDGVNKVEVTGTTDTYVEISYDPMALSAYGITSNDIANGIRNYIGQDEIIGTVMHTTAQGNQEKIALHLTTELFGKPLGEMPLKNIDGKVVYLNDLAAVQVKNQDPDSYYRVNGLNTVYINVYIPSDGKTVRMSDVVQEKMEQLKAGIHQKVYFQLSYDSAKQQREEMSKLLRRTLMSLAILLVFVWLTNRDWKYLAIVASTLAANLLIAIIVFWLFDIKLHIYSLAGITVSLGLIIDSTIVMVDHYGYYHNRKAFLSLLAAMLTTIGSMVVIFFLPKELQQDLYDFAWIVIINLVVSLVVALFFVPAIIDRWQYSSQRQHLRLGRVVVRCNRFYSRYIAFTSRRKWVYYVLLVLAFGIPFQFLPDRLGTDSEADGTEQADDEHLPWYDVLYNQTFGNQKFVDTYKPLLSEWLGGTVQMFADYLDEDSHRSDENAEKVLHIRAQMPVGGTAVQLNPKMMIVEETLKKYKEIKEFVTRIDKRNGEIVVHFKQGVDKTSFPYRLENEVIGKVITIGGADWSTYGVSERGFSNALNLLYRSNRLTLSGYNYDQLYRLAEDVCRYMRKNPRVQDLTIETPGFENQEPEFFMDYKKEQMALYQVDVDDAHGSLENILMSSYVGYYKDNNIESDVYLKPLPQTSFDLWHVENEQVKVDSSELFVPEAMKMERREAKNVIPKKNQEYMLNVAFNVMGSYTYSSEYIDGVLKYFNKTLPVGYRCENTSYHRSINEKSNYWLLFLIVVIVFFICAIQFESVRQSLVIVSVIPVALIGSFLTFCFTEIPFGSGGFASLVLLIGIVVNSGIYILSQYNNMHRLSHRGKIRDYVRAFNHKIIPIFLTVSSTIVGLVPFFMDGKDEPFWFSFATGVTGGLLFSLPALIFIMPIFCKFGEKGKR